MTYTKQTWNNKPANDTPISAERLTHIEDGIEAAYAIAAAAALTQPGNLATVATSGAYADLTGKPTIPDVSGKEDKANRNTANGYAGLDASGKVAAVLLPSYVDDVLEFANKVGFPPAGETGKIYVAKDTGRIYRWSGTTYVEIAGSPGSTDAVPEGASNLYYTQARADARVAAGIAGKVNTADLAAVAFSGNYSDLVNAPAGGAGGDGSVAWDSVTDKPNFAAVAFSGKYNDLIGAPNSDGGGFVSLAELAAGIVDKNSSIRLALDDLYGPVRVPVNLWYAAGGMVYCLTKDGDLLFTSVPAVVGLAGFANGAAFVALSDNSIGFVYVDNSNEVTGPLAANNSVTVSGLPSDAVLNGICSSSGGQLFVLSGTKIYVSTPTISPPSVSVTFTEWADAGFDAGTDICSCAYGVDLVTGSNGSGIYTATSGGDLWMTPESGTPKIALAHTDAHVRWVCNDPATSPLGVWVSADGIGVLNLFGGKNAAGNPHPVTAYNDICYCATGEKIVRYKIGDQQKTVVDDTTATLIAASMS